MTAWGSEVEQEIRRRVQLSVMAYAYEIEDNPIASDFTFDWLATRINRKLTTGHPLLDEFFIAKFSPMTGMWIHDHPELGKIKRIYTRYWSLMREHFMEVRGRRR